MKKLTWFVFILSLITGCKDSTLHQPSPVENYCDSLVIHKYEGVLPITLTREEQCVTDLLKKLKVGEYIWLKREFFTASKIDAFIETSDSLKFPKFFNAAEKSADIQYNQNRTCLKFIRLR